MSDTKYTPEPWLIDRYGARTAINSGHKHIAMVNFFNCGADDPRSITDEEHDANARMIAAAPDGLKVAEEVYLWMLINLPIDLRTYAQKELCDLRNYISYATGLDCQEIQDSYESKAAIAKANTKEIFYGSKS